MRRFVMMLCLLTIECYISHSLYAQNYRGETVAWIMQIGGKNDEVPSWRIDVDRNGDAIVSGHFIGTIELGGTTLTSNNDSFKDAFIAKVSSGGSLIWVKQIAGLLEETIPTSRLAFDSKNAVYLCFYSTSEEVEVGGTKINFGGGPAGRPKFLKLNSDGTLAWWIIDSKINQPASVVQLHTDNADNLYIATKGWCALGEYCKYSSDGSPIFVRSFPMGKSDNCATPKIQTISTDASGNSYVAIQYNITLDIEDKSFLGKYNLLLVKYNREGRIVWAREIRGPETEYALHANIEGDVWTIWGGYGILGNGFDSSPVEFGGQVLKRTNGYNAFVAKYDLEGNLLSARQLPFSFGYFISGQEDVDVKEQGDTTLVVSPGAYLVEAFGSDFFTYYQGYSYSLTPVCGSHYIVGDFKDTLRLDNGRVQLVSRGGKDIFLALMKPPGKYVPAQTGLRSPVNGTVDVDIPTKVDWWWVRCSNGYRLQVSTDTSISAMVLDTIIAHEQEHTFKNLAHSTKYYWRVRANTADTFGLWSGVASFTTVKSQPADVVLESPSNKSIGNVKNTTLRWRESKRATTYIVDVATDSSFVNKVVSGKLVSGPTLDVALDANTTCYWRVRAGNSTGTSPWSEVWSFQTRPNRPSQSILINPLNKSTGEVVNTHFVWQAQNPNEGFTLQVARDSVFTFKEREINLRETAWRDTLEASTTYYWRVRASNVVESGDWSETWSFGTGTTLDVDEESASSQLRATYTDGALLVHLPDALQDSKQAVISMYDVSGRTVITTTHVQLTDTPLRVALPRLVRGTYMVQLTLNGGKPLACSMVVE